MKYDKYTLIEENGKILGIKPVKSEIKRGIQTKFPRENTKSEDKFVSLMLKLADKPYDEAKPQVYAPVPGSKEYKQFKDALYTKIKEATQKSL